MKAIPGGQATHETIDSPTMAVWLRGGMLPQADVYPAAMRATRDLLRRRLPLTRTRAERLAHVQQTHRQYHRPAFRKPLASKANREGVAARFRDPAVQKQVAVDLARIDDAAQRRNDVEVTIVQTAKPHEAQTRYRRQAVPGLGKMWRWGWRSEMHDLTRFPRGQDVVPSCRRVTGAKASAGNRDGTSGAKVGPASLTWAVAAAAGRCRRSDPAGQQSLARFIARRQRPRRSTSALWPSSLGR